MQIDWGLWEVAALDYQKKTKQKGSKNKKHKREDGGLIMEGVTPRSVVGMPTTAVQERNNTSNAAAAAERLETAHWKHNNITMVSKPIK